MKGEDEVDSDDKSVKVLQARKLFGLCLINKNIVKKECHEQIHTDLSGSKGFEMAWENKDGEKE